LRFRRGDWTGLRWFLPRQFGDGQFHGTINWDTSKAFVLVDPAVSSQSLFRFLAQSFQIIRAFFCARFFVIAFPGRGTNDGDHDYTKEREKKHDPEPRG
jgi:hypothetical protein